MRLLKNKKAVTGMVMALIIALVTIAVVIPIGLVVTANIGDALDVVSAKTNETTVAQNVTYDIFGNVYTAFNLSALVPIVAVAGLLISIIIGAFAFRATRR